MAGYFISFEGGEGSGKTTQIKLLVAWLAARGLAERTRVTREPGGTPSAEADEWVQCRRDSSTGQLLCTRGKS